jgi:hypothetical protein
MGQNKEHDCRKNSTVISCDGERDILQCTVCGKEWECKCDFDEEYN